MIQLLQFQSYFGIMATTTRFMWRIAPKVARNIYGSTVLWSLRNSARNFYNGQKYSNSDRVECHHHCITTTATATTTATVDFENKCSTHTNTNESEGPKSTMGTWVEIPHRQHVLSSCLVMRAVACRAKVAGFIPRSYLILNLSARLGTNRETLRTY